MWNYKIAMATFRTSRFHDGDEVLKFYERRRQGIKRCYEKPKHKKDHMKKDSNRYILLRHSENSELKPQLSSKLFRACSSPIDAIQTG